MMVEIRVNGDVKHVWNTSLNAGINSGHTFKTQVELRERAGAQILKQVWEEIIPKLNVHGHIEVFFILQSKMNKRLRYPQLAPEEEISNTPIVRPAATYNNIRSNYIKETA